MSETTDTLAITEHYVRAQARHFTELAKKALTEGSRVAPTCMVICRRHVQTDEPLTTETCLVPVLMRGKFSQESFEQFMVQARAAAIAGDAIASVLVVERFAVLDVLVKSADVAGHPDRRETLTTVIEWADRSVKPEPLVLAWTRDQGFVDFEDVTHRVVQLDLVYGNEVFSDTPVDKVPADVMQAARNIAADVCIEFHERQAALLSRGAKGGQS